MSATAYLIDVAARVLCIAINTVLIIRIFRMIRKGRKKK